MRQEGWIVSGSNLGPKLLIFQNPGSIGNWWAFNTVLSKIVYNVGKSIYIMDSDESNERLLKTLDTDVWGITAGKVSTHTFPR